MRKTSGLMMLLVSCAIFSGCTSSMRSEDNQREDSFSHLQENSTVPGIQTSEPVGITENRDFTASFEIYTNGTKRIFTELKYHNQSKDVFIEARDPSSIQVKKAAITWNDFFSTLPFSLTKECLVTGTKQTFCSSDTDPKKRLRFFINDIETPEALDLQIQAGDRLRVTYGE